MHIPVLLKEVISGLDIKSDDIFFDGTINGGGHSEAISALLGPSGLLIGVDNDKVALERAKERLKESHCKKLFANSNFRNIDAILAECRVNALDKILLDLGLSSNQFDESGRGFSFQKNEPLLMTFSDNPDASHLTARDIVNRWDQNNIAEIIRSYGEERYAEKIARQIVMAREHKPIETTSDLVAIILAAVPKSYGYRKIHPATKTFQALRITVNDEIGALKEVLEKGFKSLKNGGRMAIISFHSIEDRIVKNFFRDAFKNGRGNRITKKPIIATHEEISSNPRSRSAKLRIIEKKEMSVSEAIA